MTDSFGFSRANNDFDNRQLPHRYIFPRDAAFFETIRMRRMVAWMIDFVLVALFISLVWVIVFFLGIMTFGLLFALMPFIAPLVWLVYVAATIGGEKSATLGMQMMDIEVRTWRGEKAYPLLGIAHSIIFYFSTFFLTPFILIVSLFNERARFLHDYATGVVMVRKLDIFSKSIEADKLN